MKRFDIPFVFLIILSISLILLIIYFGYLSFLSNNYFNDWLSNFSLNNPGVLLNVVDGVTMLWRVLALACVAALMVLWCYYYE